MNWDAFFDFIEVANRRRKELTMEHNIACCYLTHNHPEIVEEVLGIVCEYYDKNGIDIYLYDSSTNNLTKEIFEKKKENGADNLFYVKIDDKIGADGKMLQVLKGYGIQKHYDYIWPNKDRAYVNKKTAERIRENSHKEYDSIFIDTWVPFEHERRKYKDVYEKEEFFKEFGWLATSWDTVLFGTKLLRETINWNVFEQEYSLGVGNNFNQILVLFGGLTLIECPKIRVLTGDDIQISDCEGVSSMWLPYIFDVWGKKWPNAIEMLPECYDEYKKEVIKKEGMHEVLFGSINTLIYLRENGILTEDSWSKVREEWELLSDIPKEYVEDILNKNYDKLIRNVFDDLNRALEKQDYDKAYFIFKRTSYLKAILGNPNYWILNTCFDIYLAEVHSGKEPGIMYNIKSCNDLLNRYQRLKYYIRRLEYDIPNDGNMPLFCRNNCVTMEFLISVINKESVDKNKVIYETEKVFTKG